jgi:putative intracellular protease/amidase
MAANINVTRSRQQRVLMVAASPAVSTTLGWPVGFWASELTHAYYEMSEAGYAIEITSPKRGKIEMDSWSDPRDPSGYSAHDVISMGFLHTPHLAALLESTKPLANTKGDYYDGILICGGQAPMFTFREEQALQELIASFYESEKPVAALCHGVAALMDVKLSDGSYLITGKTMTGFSNAEEDFADAVVGGKLMPWHIEDVARERGANYIQGGLWKAFAVRDGRLITGQQQYSGAKTARLVIEAMGT